MSGKAQELLHSTRMKENVQIIMTNYSLISIIPVAGEKIDQNLNWDDDILQRLLQASVQLSTSETLSFMTILSCSCTCTASLQLLCQCSLEKL